MDIVDDDVPSSLITDPYPSVDHESLSSNGWIREETCVEASAFEQYLAYGHPGGSRCCEFSSESPNPLTSSIYLKPPLDARV